MHIMRRRKTANDIKNIEPNKTVRNITMRSEGVTVIPMLLFENIKTTATVSEVSSINDAIKTPEYIEMKNVLALNLLYLIK